MSSPIGGAAAPLWPMSYADVGPEWLIFQIFQEKVRILKCKNFQLLHIGGKNLTLCRPNSFTVCNIFIVSKAKGGG